jgi:hypothetical protein
MYDSRTVVKDHSERFVPIRPHSRDGLMRCGIFPRRVNPAVRLISIMRAIERIRCYMI